MIVVGYSDGGVVLGGGDDGAQLQVHLKMDDADDDTLMLDDG